MQITDKGARHLTVHRGLRFLDVAGCVALTQQGFADLAGHLRQLHTLKLGGCSRMATVNDACMAALVPLTSLTHLDASGCIDLTDAGDRTPRS